MGLVLVFVAAVLGGPLLLVGMAPLAIASRVPCVKPSVARGVGAGAGVLLAMALVGYLVLLSVIGKDEVFVILVWCAAWAAVAPGTAIAFGVLWARIAHHPSAPSVWGLSLRAIAPWPLGLLALVVPWHAVNMIGMGVLLALSVLPAPIGVAWAAASVHRRFKANAAAPLSAPTTAT